MKITVGSTMGITLSNIPYSPIKVESTLQIEKVFNEELEGEALDKAIEDLNAKVEKVLHSDLEKKMLESSEKQKDLKRRIERALWERKELNSFIQREGMP